MKADRAEHIEAGAWKPYISARVSAKYLVGNVN